MAARYSKAEIAAIEKDAAYWQKVSEVVPTWTLNGFSGRHRATFFTGGKKTVAPGLAREDQVLANAAMCMISNNTDFIRLTAAQRDELVAAFERRPNARPRVRKSQAR